MYACQPLNCPFPNSVASVKETRTVENSVLWYLMHIYPTKCLVFFPSVRFAGRYEGVGCCFNVLKLFILFLARVV